ncbi:MAG TPA: CYTH domain-containing protein [Tepidisphaeraceae bacterium]|jgi:CYTH domain-containing protein
MERERKFLVEQTPARLARFPHQRIRQGYLATSNGRGDAEIRLRDDGEKHLLTAKQGSGGTRTEIEVPIGGKAFRSLWRLTKGRRLEKVRYRIPVGRLTIELDVYRGKLDGLRTAEVEFSTAGQLRKFRPPPWLGREITGEQKYSNSRLATLNRRPATAKH